MQLVLTQDSLGFPFEPHPRIEREVDKLLCTYQCQAGQGGLVAGHRAGFHRSLWPGGRAFELSCCPGLGILEFLFVPVTTNHFTG